MIAYRNDNTEKDNNPKKYIGGIVEVSIEDFDWEKTSIEILEFLDKQLDEQITEDIDYEIIEPKQLPSSK